MNHGQNVVVTERNRGVETARHINGGVDSGISATDIQPNQFSRAFNTTFRGGEPTCRPGWLRRAITWASSADKAKWDTGYFQGADIFILDNGTPYIVASVSGNIFAIRVTDWTGKWLAGGNSSLLTKAWMVQGEDVFVIQDGQSKAYIWDAAIIRRAMDNEVPTGTAMAYGRGRLWVARARSYIGGDIVYGDPTFGRRNILRFTENTFLNEGGEFAVPVKDSRITALAFVARQDEGTKEGGLMVFTPGSIFEFEAPIDRTVWKDLQQPLQRFALIGFGSLGADCVGNVNGDLWFRAEDGIRSFYFGQRQFGAWGNTPQSNEVRWILDNDTVSMLYNASSVNFDNRFLTTALPYFDLQRGYVYRGFTTVDFTGISSLRKMDGPAWDGFWAGPNDAPIFKLIAADTRQGRRCWALCMVNGLIEIHELTKNGNYDDEVPINWWYQTKDYDWSDNQTSDGSELKRLSHVEQWHRGAKGIFTTTVRYRTDEQPCWNLIRSWEECVTERQCTVNVDCLPPPMMQPVSLPRRGSAHPPDTANCSEQTPNRLGYTAQFRFEHTGKAFLKRLKFVAERQPESTGGKIIPSNDCGGPPDCLSAACCQPPQYKSS